MKVLFSTIELIALIKQCISCSFQSPICVYACVCIYLIYNWMSKNEREWAKEIWISLSQEANLARNSRPTTVSAYILGRKLWNGNFKGEFSHFVWGSHTLVPYSGSTGKAPSSPVAANTRASLAGNSRELCTPCGPRPAMCSHDALLGGPELLVLCRAFFLANEKWCQPGRQ